MNCIRSFISFSINPISISFLSVHLEINSYKMKKIVKLKNGIIIQIYFHNISEIIQQGVSKPLNFYLQIELQKICINNKDIYTSDKYMINKNNYLQEFFSYKKSIIFCCNEMIYNLISSFFNPWTQLFLLNLTAFKSHSLNCSIIL